MSATDGRGAAALGRLLVDGHLLDEVGLADEPLWLTFERAAGGAPHGEGSTDRPEIGLPRRWAEPYWILAEGRRVGTVALGDGLAESPAAIVNLTSLFVDPAHRGNKTATRLLEGVTARLEPAGVGALRLETDWCAFRAIPLYLGLGMRVWSWEHELVFTWSPQQARWSMAIDGDTARCIVEGRDVITARRRGDRLDWSARAPLEGSELEATFAVALAARGFPLLTDDHERIARRGGAREASGPDGLALRIQEWEAAARGVRGAVSAPRVPGLAYPAGRDLARRALGRRGPRSVSS